MSDIFSEQSLIESVVSGRHRSVRGEERGSPHYLKSLTEVKVVILNIFTKPLKPGERGVSLVAMVDLRIDAEIPEGSDAADAEQELLLQTVLPVAAVEVIGHLTVLRRVRFIVSVKQIEVCTTNSHLPTDGP